MADQARVARNPRPSWLPSALLRALGIAASAFVSAAVCGLAALIALQLRLPETDGAYGTPLSLVLNDPFVFTVWQVTVVVGGLLGTLLGLAELWNVRLVRAVPTVLAVSTSVAFCLGFFSPFLAVVGVLFAVWPTMRLCTSVDAWRIPTPTG